jgi:hypothetical protein
VGGNRQDQQSNEEKGSHDVSPREVQLNRQGRQERQGNTEESNLDGTTGTTKETAKKMEPPINADERRSFLLVFICVHLRPSAVPAFFVFLGVLGGLVFCFAVS